MTTRISVTRTAGRVEVRSFGRAEPLHEAIDVEVRVECHPRDRARALAYLREAFAKAHADVEGLTIGAEA